MGGDGSGGARVGTGPKPRDIRAAWLGGHAGKRSHRAAPEQPERAPVARPEGLAADIEAVWDDLAPHAIQAGTLVPGTVPAFLRLCQAILKHAQMEQKIAQDGLTYLKVTIDGSGQEHTEIKAHPLISRASSLDNSIRAWFKDFAINPFGKPLAAATVKPADPFAKFGAAG